MRGTATESDVPDGRVGLGRVDLEADERVDPEGVGHVSGVREETSAERIRHGAAGDVGRRAEVGPGACRLEEQMQEDACVDARIVGAWAGRGLRRRGSRSRRTVRVHAWSGTSTSDASYVSNPARPTMNVRGAAAKCTLLAVTS